MSTMLSSLLLFGYTGIFLVIIPLLVLSRVDTAWRYPILVSGGMAAVVGIIGTTFIGAVLHALHLPVPLLWLFGIGYLWYWYTHTSYWQSAENNIWTKRMIFPCVILMIGVATQTLVLIRGGWQTPQGYIFPSQHDTMWNIAIAQQARQQFPPQHPGMSGEVLRNNHYFYPVFLAIVTDMTGMSLFPLYFVYGPLVVSLLFGLGLYTLSTIWIKQETGRAIAVLLGYFSGSFAYLLPLFLGSHFDWKGNTFSADQPFDQMINPYAVLGFTMYLFGSYALYRSLNHQEKAHRWWMGSAALLFGTLYGYKAFGGIIAIVSLAVLSLYSLVRWRDARFLKRAFWTALVFVPIFFLLTEPTVSSLVFAPGWLLTGMMSDQDKLHLPDYVNAYAYYQSIRNYLGMAKLVTIELAFYLFGNLGVRILGVGVLVASFFYSRKREQQLLVTFLLVSCTVSLAIPLLFNLGANAHNIIQFTPYALVILSVMTAVGLIRVQQFLARKGQGLWGILFLVVVIVLAIPVNVKNIYSKLALPDDRISYQEMAGLSYIRDHAAAGDVLLINPHQSQRSMIYVSGITGKAVYLADATYAVQTGRNPQERLMRIADYFSDHPTEPARFLRQHAIRWIYVLRQSVPNIEDFAGKRNLTVQYQNREIAVLAPKE